MVLCIAMASSKFKIVVVGHSFVRRFSEFSCSSPDPRIKSNLGLSPDQFEVFFIGIGGATAHSIHTHINKVKGINPDVVIVEIGSNDLAKKPNSQITLWRWIRPQSS